MHNKNTIAKILKYAFSVFGALAIVYIVSMFIFAGIDKSEIAECLKWKQHSDQYPGFFLASWQKQQCDAHNIIF